MQTVMCMDWSTPHAVRVSAACRCALQASEQELLQALVYGIHQPFMQLTQQDADALIRPEPEHEVEMPRSRVPQQHQPQALRDRSRSPAARGVTSSGSHGASPSRATRAVRASGSGNAASPSQRAVSQSENEAGMQRPNQAAMQMQQQPRISVGPQAHPALAAGQAGAVILDPLLERKLRQQADELARRQQVSLCMHPMSLPSTLVVYCMRFPLIIEFGCLMASIALLREGWLADLYGIS